MKPFRMKTMPWNRLSETSSTTSPQQAFGMSRPLLQRQDTASIGLSETLSRGKRLQTQIANDEQKLHQQSAQLASKSTYSTQVLVHGDRDEERSSAVSTNWGSFLWASDLVLSLS